MPEQALLDECFPPVTGRLESVEGDLVSCWLCGALVTNRSEQTVLHARFHEGLQKTAGEASRAAFEITPIGGNGG